VGCRPQPGATQSTHTTKHAHDEDNNYYYYYYYHPLAAATRGSPVGLLENP